MRRFLKEQNDQERAGQVGLFEMHAATKVANTAFASGLRQIMAGPSESLVDVHRQAAEYRAWEQSAE